MIMKKLFNRLLVSSLLTIVVTISGITTIIFFPEPLFAHSAHYRQFNVYSNQAIDESFIFVLDDAMKLVTSSELYDSQYTFDIFLAHGSLFNSIDDGVLGRGPSARATDSNIVVKVRIDAEQRLAFPIFYEICEADLVWLIAHEMIHCLQEHRYGKATFNPFSPPPLWKLEGYPEYISRSTKRADNNYSLTKEIDRYITLEKASADFWIPVEEAGCKSPGYYYKSRLMTEYLIDIRHWTYDRILKDTTSDKAIFAEMIRWRNGEAE